MKQYTDWCLTLNNPTTEELYDVFDICNNMHFDIYKKFIVGFEGDWQEEVIRTPHMQICFSLNVPVHFSVIKRDWPRAHIEAVKDFNASWAYCKKEGLFFSYDKDIFDQKARFSYEKNVGLTEI